MVHAETDELEFILYDAMWLSMIDALMTLLNRFFSVFSLNSYFRGVIFSKHACADHGMIFFPNTRYELGLGTRKSVGLALQRPSYYSSNQYIRPPQIHPSKKATS